MAFSFGSNTGPTATTTTGFSLGGPPAKAPATGFGFGSSATTTSQPAAPATGGFGFGTAAAATTAAPAFGGFGAAATTASTVGGFGTTATTPSLGGFGAAKAAPTVGGFGATTAAPTLGGFGTAVTTSAAAPAFGGFGSATSTPAAATPAFGAASSLTTTTAAPSLTAVSGLGGRTVGPVQGGQPAVNQGNKGEAGGPSGKESMIPQELWSTVEDLKKLIKEEKAVSSEVSHTSDKQLKKVKEETEALSQLVNGLASGVQNNRAKLDQLKKLSGQELVNVEIAVRTRETPPSMQYENVAPMEYFRRLVSQFEQSMMEYRQGILSAENHLQVVTNGCPITSSDIVTAVQKLHQALTDLAAKYQVLHTAISQQKYEYLSLQRTLTTSNSTTTPRSGVSLPSSLKGPSPFHPPADPLTQARQAQLHRTHSGQGPPTQTLGQQSGGWGAQTGQAFGTNTSAFGANTTGFGANTTGFGTNTTGFGANTSAFGANTTAFGATTSGFGSNTSGFGANTSGFGGSGFGASNVGITSGTKRGKH